jgi:hypothetical protein
MYAKVGLKSQVVLVLDLVVPDSRGQWKGR